RDYCFLILSALLNVITHQNGWKSFRIKCSDRIVNISVLPKVFKRLEEGTEKYGHWTAEISGKMGESTNAGFILEDPIVQVLGLTQIERVYWA
ncbi:MAG: hypothetical protein ACKO96_48890, partial [Flammeovirgaceae bacterium]